jgi:ATP-binding cassette subfamily F protein uup
MLDRLCTELVGLDGRGGHGIYGSLLQYQRAMEMATQTKPAEKKPPEKTTAAPAGPKPAAKRLTWNEQRELEQMETKVHEAESKAAGCQQQMSDPRVLSDHARLAEICRQASEAQELVRKLYARWEELEAKQGR